MKSLSFKIKDFAIGALAGSVPALGETFTVTAGSGPFALAPGGTKLMTVTFQPASIGALTAPLVITVTPRRDGRPPASR
jgi:hypothetical protein